MASKLINIHREDGRVIGYVEGQVFYKFINGKIHFLIIPPAIAFDECSLREAEKRGALHVCVTDKDTGKKYWAPIKLIWDKGIPVDRDYGEQRALLMKYWSETPTTQTDFLGELS